MVYLACVVMVAPIIRSTYGNTSIYAYTSIYVVYGPEIYAFRTTLLMSSRDVADVVFCVLLGLDLLE